VTWGLDDILAACGGELLCGEAGRRIAGIGIDSRTIAPGEAFVAIRGEVHDGHDFAAQAVEKGAAAAVVERTQSGAILASLRAHAGAAVVAVADTTRALGDLAAFHRRRLPVPAVAVTGSNGKTSTRRMTAAVLARAGELLEPARNLNNQIGLPLTLLKLDRRHRFAVLELGTNRPGEIARLAEICRPEVGVITNIGPAHLEGLGSLEGVRREKTALLAGLAPGGRAVLNADDPLLRGLPAAAAARALWFGLESRAEVRAAELREAPEGIAFRLELPGREPVAVRLRAHGRVMVQNALAAAAAGHLLGLSPAMIREGLEAFALVAGRLAVERLPGGVTLVDDSYNANPGSVGAALAMLSELRGAGRGILVMGDMRELGPAAGELHRGIGELAAKSGVGRIYACGDFAAEVAAGARRAGMPAAGIVCGPRDAVQAALLAELSSGDWVLVKGSRAAGMEAVAAAVRSRAAAGGR
jgi:UDP-N-acetylmuramoyl-tripeptide--D-alanyl-D-alanine ligase